MIDGKAHAALFDPLKTIKNEADTTNEAVDVKPDPFAEIGKTILRALNIQKLLHGKNIQKLLAWCLGFKGLKGS